MGDDRLDGTRKGVLVGADGPLVASPLLVRLGPADSYHHATNKGHILGRQLHHVGRPPLPWRGIEGGKMGLDRRQEGCHSKEMGRSEGLLLPQPSLASSCLPPWFASSEQVSRPPPRATPWLAYTFMTTGDMRKRRAATKRRAEALTRWLHGITTSSPQPPPSTAPSAHLCIVAIVAEDNLMLRRQLRAGPNMGTGKARHLVFSRRADRETILHR